MLPKSPKSPKFPSPKVRSRSLNTEDQLAKVAADDLPSGTVRSYLLTVLGELVLPRGRPAWTSALLHALTGVGIAEKAVRQALMRATASGWIEPHPVGRQTCWTLTALGRQVIEEGADRVRSMSQRSLPWDGRWLILLLGDYAEDRTTKKKLARALSWVGFGNPTGDLWVSPHSTREQELRRLLEGLGMAHSAYAFIGPASQAGLTDRQIVEKSWNLDVVADHYDRLIKRFARMRPSSGDGMLFSFIQLVNEWQRVPFIDPGLPSVLLPPDWSGREVVARLESMREIWSAQAHKRWDEVVGVVPTT